MRRQPDVGRSAGFVAVVDYGAGNLRSVGGALDRLGVGWRLARAPEGLRAASAVVLPGVGSAGAAMRELEKSGLAEAIRGLEPPLLGICLGLQLLFERSDEEGGVRCLGMLPGRVGRLRETPRLPHMGWNHARPLAGHPLFEGLGPEGDWFYFAHSYACDCPPEVALAETTHGASFVSAAGLASVCGVQFHPEKSAGAGLRLLARFLRMAGLETTVEPGRPAAGETVRSRRPWSASEPGAGQRESRASGRSRGR